MKIRTRMKRYIKAVILMLVISAIAHAQPVNLLRDHRGGNGGISVAADFSMVAHNFVKVWENLCNQGQKKTLKCMYIMDFKSLLDKESSLYTKIQVEDKTEAYDGEEREAVNDGFSTITVNKKQWLQMQKSKDEQDQLRILKLVVHEYFSIMGLDSSDYYKASNDVIGVILRKGILPEALIRAEGLPNLCSLNLMDNQTNVQPYELNILRNKSYVLNDISEVSRYSLKIRRACFSEGIGDICTIYIEQFDNLTQKSVYNNIFAKRAIFKSDSKLEEEILKSALSKIKACF